jgi:aspartate aminotransferase
LNFPNNPTGLIPSKESLQKLAKYFRENNWIILSDEIYSGLTFKKENFFSFGQILPERTIVLGGISKWAASGGWRLGYAALPPLCLPWMTTINSVISETISCVAAPIQFASVAAFEDSQEMKDFLLISNKVLEFVGNYSAQRFRDMGANVIDPQGAFYIFPDFSQVLTKEIREKHKISTSEDFQNELFDKVGFSVLPGLDFERNGGEMTLRVSFIDFEGDKIMNLLMGKITELKSESDKVSAIQSVLDQDFMKTYGPNIVEGLDKFDEYIKSLSD